MEYLRKNNPEFFKDEKSQQMGAIIILELKEVLEPLDPIQRVTAIAAIMAMMYQMGSAAIQSLRDKKGRGMAKIFIANWKHKRVDAEEEELEKFNSIPEEKLQRRELKEIDEFDNDN